jgi:hypothetical protein
MCKKYPPMYVPMYILAGVLKVDKHFISRWWNSRRTWRGPRPCWRTLSWWSKGQSPTRRTRSSWGSSKIRWLCRPAKQEQTFALWLIVFYVFSVESIPMLPFILYLTTTLLFGHIYPNHAYVCTWLSTRKTADTLKLTEKTNVCTF